MIKPPWETDDYESGTRHERTTAEAAQNWQKYSDKLQSLLRDFSNRSEFPQPKDNFQVLEQQLENSPSSKKEPQFYQISKDVNIE